MGQTQKDPTARQSKGAGSGEEREMRNHSWLLSVSYCKHSAAYKNNTLLEIEIKLVLKLLNVLLMMIWREKKLDLYKDFFFFKDVLFGSHMKY